MHLLLHIMSQLIPYELKKATTEETKEMHEGITDLYLHECRFSENPFSSNVQLNVTKPTSDSFLESRTFCSSKCQAFSFYSHVCKYVLLHSSELLCYIACSPVCFVFYVPRFIGKKRLSDKR